MMYEEKKELRRQMAQLLADAGLNRESIEEIVTEEIQKRVDQCIQNTINHLNAQSQSGDFIYEKINKYLHDKWLNNYSFERAIKDVLANKVVSITLKDTIIDDDM